MPVASAAGAALGGKPRLARQAQALQPAEAFAREHAAPTQTQLQQNMPLWHIRIPIRVIFTRHWTGRHLILNGLYMAQVLFTPLPKCSLDWALEGWFGSHDGEPPAFQIQAHLLAK